MDITFRPRLVKGRHPLAVDETGPFCLVEAVGFNVDGSVNDRHPSVDPVLSALARTLNDRMCDHYSHPLAEAAGMIEPTQDICVACQARLWAVGERIAGTGFDTLEWSAAELAAAHVHLALEAAGAVLRLIEGSDPLHALAAAALEAGAYCLADPATDNLVAARLAATAIEEQPGDFDNSPAVWAAHTAVHAARAAAAVAGDKLDATLPTYYIANMRAIEAMTYALGAAAGDPPASMRVARRVLNAFGKFTSQSESDADVIAAGIAADLPAGAVVLYGCEERTTVEGIGYPCVKLGEHVEHETALGAVWWAAPELPEGWEYHEWTAEERAEQNPTEDEVGAGDDEGVDDFDESELGDVVDEAIGDLERAEAVLHAIAAEHRPVAAWTRRHGVGLMDVQYQTDCCLSCRDAEGQPTPAPCRTAQLLDGYGEA